MRHIFQHAHQSRAPRDFSFGSSARLSLTLLAVAALMLASGCADTRSSRGTQLSAATPSLAKGRYKVGRPYVINGIWYYPSVDYDYDETGVASWYGPGFQKQDTANGETYDMNDLTAAHKTLPMPSIVQVTNLDNGRSIKLRVNDRGPFVQGRIIDVSRRAAQLLGFYQQGTAQVRVKIIADESRWLAESMAREPTAAVAIPPAAAAVVAATAPEPMPQHLSPVMTAASDAPAPFVAEAVEVEAPAPAVADWSQPGLAASSPPSDEKLFAWNTAADSERRAGPFSNEQPVFVQAGAFADRTNAQRARHRLAPIGKVEVNSTNVNGSNLFRVRVGPFASTDEAERKLAAVMQAGFVNPRIVFE
jgi:rare lipoprotein A